MPFIRVIVFFTRCTERTAGDSFNNWTWTNMSTSKTVTLASSVVWLVPFAVTDECFDFWIVFSHQMKWSSCVHNEHSLSLPTYFSQVNKHCLRELVWRTYFDSQNINLELCTRFFVKSKLPYLLQSLEHLDFVDYEIWSGWLQVQVPNLSLQNTLVREIVKSHSVLGLGIRMIFGNSICCSSFDGMWIATDEVFLFFFHQQISLCVWIHMCLRKMCIYLALWILYIHEHANNHMNFPFRNFPSWRLYKGSLFAFPDGRCPVNLWCAFSTSVIATFSVTCRI